jgi:membrane-associated protease RseP (regulator of RpoE activity)
VAVDGAGAPVVRFDIQVIPAEGPNLPDSRNVGGMEEGTRRTVNSPGGAFEVNGLQPGKYDVLVTTLDGGAGRLAAMSLRAGEVRRGLRVNVGAGLRLKGRVVDAETGKPIPGIGVGMTRTRDHVLTRTDADGAFAIDRLVPGRTIVINVRGDENQGHVGENREITLPEDKAEVEISPIRLLRTPNRDGGFGSGAIGVRLSNREGPPTIIDVASGSPAARAGLEAGAVIRSIDGKDVTGYGRTAALLLLRGAPGTPINLAVDGPQGRRTVTLVREEIKGL